MANHPVYTKLKAEAEAKGRTPYLDTADAAKCIRSVLKSTFPKTKFSVTISRYSGGSSVRISWMDGPTDEMVSRITAGFEGKGFDGMIDMAYHMDSYLMPDGSAAFAATSGTTGSLGMVEKASAWKPHPDAIRVSGHAYVFTSRSYSIAFLERTLAAYSRKNHGDELAEAIDSGAVKVEPGWDGSGHVTGAGHIRCRNHWGDMEIYREAGRRMVA